jgi:hypothetical protein
MRTAQGALHAALPVCLPGLSHPCSASSQSLGRLADSPPRWPSSASHSHLLPPVTTAGTPGLAPTPGLALTPGLAPTPGLARTPYVHAPTPGADMAATPGGVAGTPYDGYTPGTHAPTSTPGLPAFTPAFTPSGVAYTPGTPGEALAPLSVLPCCRACRACRAGVLARSPTGGR